MGNTVTVMNVLLDPEVWDVDKVESLLGQHYNISGKFMVKNTALCIERVSTDTEGIWYYELEMRGEPSNKQSFPTFLNMLEFIVA